MPDKFKLFNGPSHDESEREDEKGRVKDPDIAHEMAKIEDPYHKRDAFGLIKARQYRIKKGEKLAEKKGEELLRKKHEAEAEKRLAEDFQPKEPYRLDFNQKLLNQNWELLEHELGVETKRERTEEAKKIADYFTKLIIKEGIQNFPLEREVVLLEIVGTPIIWAYFSPQQRDADMPYYTMHDEIIEAIAESLKKHNINAEVRTEYEKLNFKLYHQMKKDSAEIYIRSDVEYEDADTINKKNNQENNYKIPKIQIYITRLSPNNLDTSL